MDEITRNALKEMLLKAHSESYVAGWNTALETCAKFVEPLDESLSDLFLSARQEL